MPRDVRVRKEKENQQAKEKFDRYKEIVPSVLKVDEWSDDIKNLADKIQKIVIQTGNSHVSRNIPEKRVLQGLLYHNSELKESGVDYKQFVAKLEVENTEQVRFFKAILDQYDKITGVSVTAAR